MAVRQYKVRSKTPLEGEAELVTNKTVCSKAQRLVELKFARAELDHLERFRRAIQLDHEVTQLKLVSGLRDQELAERLHHAGFNARNIQALSWLPIAMVAWASDGVSAQEITAARILNLHARDAYSVESAKLFQNWLTEKPSEELWSLWEEYVRSLAGSQSSQETLQTGQMILEIAKRVARASGGMLGFGQVSSAERAALDRISRVFGL